MTTEKTSFKDHIIVLMGVVVLIVVVYKVAFSSNDSVSNKRSDETKSEFENALKQGDADSPLDTIRRLKANAEAATETANKATEELGEYKKTSDLKYKRLLGTVNEKLAQTSGSQEIKALKSEFENFSKLIQGQLNQVQTKQSKEISLNHLPSNGEDWVSIGSVDHSEFSQNYVDSSGFLLNESGKKTDPESRLIPVATIPENSPLINSTTMSTLIGRLPKGGSVFEPYSFYVVTGARNLAAQGHEIPYLEKAIWRGVATGDKDLRCIRGKLVSVTFVFTDGTIQTTKAESSEALGEIVTPSGTNCVPGKLVSNTGKYIAMISAGGAISAFGEAAAEAETTTSVTGSGVLSSVTGDTAKFLAGKAISKGADAGNRIIEEEYQNSYASVVVRSGVPINLIALQEIPIDYDPDGRKVNHLLSKRR